MYLCNTYLHCIHVIARLQKYWCEREWRQFTAGKSAWLAVSDTDKEKLADSVRFSRMYFGVFLRGLYFKKAKKAAFDSTQQ